MTHRKIILSLCLVLLIGLLPQRALADDKKPGSSCSAHSYTGTVAQAPTLSEPGIINAVCRRCGLQAKAFLPPLDDVSYTVTHGSQQDIYTWKSTSLGDWEFTAPAAEPSQNRQPEVPVQPVITQQPADRTVKAGEQAIFSIRASGQALSYQWQFFGKNQRWQNCTALTEGFNSDILHPIVACSRNGFQYRCIISDETGGFVISYPALLLVK